MKSAAPAALVERVLNGDQGALARALSVVTNESEGHEALAKGLFVHHGGCHKIGLCGPPGSGKSSLVNRLVARLRAAGERVAVLAVDPTSPFTGGAFLGDRLRVQGHALDEGVFMRSLATRGMMGGLNATIFGAIRVLEAFGRGPAARSGFNRILIETVGTGQDEVDIADAADSVLLVCAPYQGDEFQALKAGTMEIADIFAVNKADLEEADRTVTYLREALSLGSDARDPTSWRPLVLPVSSATGKGVEELGNLLDAHRDSLAATGEGSLRRRRQMRRELSLSIYRRVTRDAVDRIRESHIDMLLERKSDPATLGRKLIRGAGPPPRGAGPPPRGAAV